MKRYIVAAIGLVPVILYFMFPSRSTTDLNNTAMQELSTIQEPIHSNKKGSVAIPLIFNGEDFYGSLVVGTAASGNPAQVLRCYFSTDSKATPNLYVAGVEGCKPKTCTERKITPFNYKTSPTYKALEETFSHSFTNSKRLQGRVSMDNIKIETGDSNLVILKDHVFGKAETFDEMFVYNEAVYGLSLVYDHLLPNSPEPLVFTLTSHFTKQVFGFYLNSHENGKLLLGGGDEGLYVGELESHDVYKNGQEYMGWYIKVDQLIVCSELCELIRPRNGLLLAQVNSAIEYIEGPQWAVDRINNAIYKSAGMEDTAKPGEPDKPIPCKFSTIIADPPVFPEVSFIISGKKYTLDPFDYFSRDQETELCLSQFKAADTPYFQLGHVFMKRFYTRFDVETKQVQFAPLKK